MRKGLHLGLAQRQEPLARSLLLRGLLRAAAPFAERAPERLDADEELSPVVRPGRVEQLVTWRSTAERLDALLELALGIPRGEPGVLGLGHDRVDDGARRRRP